MKSEKDKKNVMLWALVGLGTAMALIVVYWIGMFVYCSMNPIACMESAGRKYLEKQGFESKTVDTGDYVLHYFDSDTKGEPMVFLHGRIFSSTQFARHAFLKDLAENGFRLILVDMPGHGLSKSKKAGPSMLTLDLMASAVSGVIRSLEPKPIVLVGYGLGGWVAFKVAESHPQWLDKLVLIEPEGVEKSSEELLPASRKQWREALKKAEPGVSGFSGLDNLIDDMMRKAGEIGLESLYKGVKDDDFILGPGIRTFRVKTAVIYGKENLLNPPSQGKRLAQRLDNAVFRTVEDAGAAPFIRKPRKTAEVMLEAMHVLSVKSGEPGHKALTTGESG